MAISNSSLQIFRFTNIVLLVGYWAFMIVAYPNLPDQIPMHFDADGDATRLSETSIFSWFLVPGIVSVVLIPLLFIGKSLRQLPLNSAWFNYPFKERIVKFKINEQNRLKLILIRYIERFLNITFFWMILLFMAGGLHRYLYATSNSSIPILSVSVSILLILAVHLGWLYVLLRKKLELNLNEG